MSCLPVAVPAAVLGLALGASVLSPSGAQARPSGLAHTGHAAQAGRAALPAKSVWLAKVRAKLAGANAYLDAHAHDAAKPALVLDIDNTSLATHYSWPKAVKPTLKVAKHAVADGYTVFFVTGRTPGSAAAARRPLTAAGYTYADVLGRPKGAGLAASKQANRATIAAQGYTVVMDIGNRKTDLTGANVGHGIKLPSFHGLLS